MNQLSPPATAAIAAINAQTQGVDDDRTQLVAAKCRALVVGYNARWRDQSYKPLAVEQFVQADLVNPDTNSISRTFRIAGKEDVIVTDGSRRLLMDAKTCSQDISDPNAPYWQQLAIEAQPTHYMLIDWLSGLKCDGAVWDVLRKPTIAPKKLTKADRARVCAERSYCDTAMSEDTLAAVPVNDRETLEMYEARLVKDCTTIRPDWYFQRRFLVRLDANILEYARELWQHSQDILATRAIMRKHSKNGDTRLPVRNSGACMLYGSPCVFLGLCSDYDQPNSDRWQRKPTVHSELPALDGDGRDVLTNSRIRCFQTCRRKHYYQYELGIERQDAEEREALFFGSLWHTALEAWWNAQRKETNCGCTN